MQMADEFSRYAVGLDSPARDAVAVTPNDGADLANVCRALYVGVSGDIKLTTPEGTVLTFKNVPAGVFPVGAKRVWQTGTTASEIIAVTK